MELTPEELFGVSDGKPIFCYFCGKQILFYNEKESDCLCVHSLDGNHENWDSRNKVPAHIGCHVSFHRTGRSNGKLPKNFWKSMPKNMREVVEKMNIAWQFTEEELKEMEKVKGGCKCE